MNLLRVINCKVLSVASVPNQPSCYKTIKRWRRPSICNLCFYPQQARPCFDLKQVSWERGEAQHAAMIRSFLQHQYWPREPTVTALWMDTACPYLLTLTDRYAYTGDRFLAFERLPRTGEKRLAGVLVANKIWPWMIQELREWANSTRSDPEKHRMYLLAHCLESPDLFNKYNVDYIYDVEVLGTAPEVAGQGVATQLLRNALLHAEDLRHPLVQVIAFSQYVCKICERCGMSRVWSMEYSEFVDSAGRAVFYPRRPHTAVSVYVKSRPLSTPGRAPCKPPW